MKKIPQILAVFLMVFIFSAIPTIQASAAPAPPVSSVSVTDAKVGDDGYIYVYVDVVGYGKNIYSTFDGVQCSLNTTKPIGNPIVTGFQYEMKGPKAVTGNHPFTFRITSVNYPWNTVSASATITIN